MKDLTNFNSAQFGELRVKQENGELWFCLVDVCRALEIGNHRDVANRLKQKGVVLTDTLTPGGMQKLLFVNEENFYRGVFSSRKREAESFQDWVFGDVLPSIRRTGKYARKLRKTIAPRRRDERCGQFYEDLTRLVTHEDEREIAGLLQVSRSFVHDVLRGQKTGYRVLEALVARAKENRRNGVERVVPFMASAEMHAQLVLACYCGEE